MDRTRGCEGSTIDSPGLLRFSPRSRSFARSAILSPSGPSGLRARSLLEGVDEDVRFRGGGDSAGGIRSQQRSSDTSFLSRREVRTKRVVTIDEDGDESTSFGSNVLIPRSLRVNLLKRLL